MIDISQIDFEKVGGLVPAVVQDANTQIVLMLGFMNPEALQKTLAEGKVTFFSRTKNRLWTKGETSGNYLIVTQIYLDCDQDTLLIKALPQGVICHTGADTCFDEKNQASPLLFLEKLSHIIKDRKQNPQAEAYTSKLFSRGINKIAQKVGEEAVEVLIEAKDNNTELFKNECADLIFHLLVLLEAKNVPLQEVVEVLAQRHEAQS